MGNSTPVKITDTTLRDAHQSLLATRMSTSDMLPVLGLMDRVGFHSLEMWGGATFDSCMRFLDEDPWERLELIRSRVKNTKLQMLLRGQNVLGYRNYADDVVQSFVKLALEKGIDIIRIFDAVNDVRNMATAIKATKQYGGHAQGTVVYTISPVHNTQHYLQVVRDLVDLGVDSICIKDMAGLLAPYAAYDLVKQIKETVQIPVQLHCHYTSGMASMAYMKAIEAGVDVIDCAMSPMALGTSQPPVETIVAALQGTQHDMGLDLELLNQVADHFKQVKKNYEQFAASLGGVDTNVLSYQIPGGMISNLVSQLTSQNALDRYDEVLAEVPKVRADLGYPPLVTPTSQMVGAQALFNVFMDERYKIVPKEIRRYVLGYYGRPPADIDPQVKQQVIGRETPITCRPADLIEPELPAAREAVAQWSNREEDVLSYALFPQVATEFFNKKYGQQ